MLILLLPVVGAVALFVFMCLRGTAEPNRFGPKPVPYCGPGCDGRLGYCALATPRPSKSTLRFNATVRPSTPSRRSTELNSERCTASWLIVPSR